MSKVISTETALQARGLFALAQAHYVKLRDAERALHDLLGYPEEDPAYCECLSDEIYQEERGDFDRGLKKDGYIVKPAPKSKRR